MKVLPFKIPKPENRTLVYQEDYETIFYDQLHQHEEIQISYIVEGAGSLLVGDTIHDYKKNDIFIIGENIPHVFRSDTQTSHNSLMYSLFFTRRSFGKDFFDLADLNKTNRFFKDVEYGIKILSNKKRIIKHFKKLKNQTKIERIASLLKILDRVIISEKQPLSAFVYKERFTDGDGKRMGAVFEYALDHFQEYISLEEIAEKANMSKNAFCRYFKKRTNKTFFQFLIEIRIENACKLLYKEKDLSVALISELCGFHNIANFNRKFKELKQMTPSQYKSQF